MAEIERTIDNYIAVWNETDGERRRDLISQTWTEDGRYLNPMLSGEGPGGIDVMTQGVQDQFPGHAFRRTGRPMRIMIGCM